MKELITCTECLHHGPNGGTGHSNPDCRYMTEEQQIARRLCPLSHVPASSGISVKEVKEKLGLKDGEFFSADPEAKYILLVRNVTTMGVLTSYGEALKKFGLSVMIIHGSELNLFELETRLNA